MMQFTEEQKAALIAFNEEKLEGLKFAVKQHALKSVRAELQNELTSTEIALASLTAEPVAWRDPKNSLPEQGCTYDPSEAERCAHIFKQPLYTLPPTPVLQLPDEWTLADAEKFISDMTPPTEEEAALFARNGLLDEVKRLNATAPQPVPDAWKLVPVEPTEDMIIRGFESAPNVIFSDPVALEEYQEMSGCQQAAHRAKLCYAAMLEAAPELE